MKMLEKEPSKRITIEEALKHPWINKYDQYIREIK